MMYQQDPQTKNKRFIYISSIFVLLLTLIQPLSSASNISSSDNNISWEWCGSNHLEAVIDLANYQDQDTILIYSPQNLDIDDNIKKTLIFFDSRELAPDTPASDYINSEYSLISAPSNLILEAVTYSPQAESQKALSADAAMMTLPDDIFNSHSREEEKNPDIFSFSLEQKIRKDSYLHISFAKSQIRTFTIKVF